MAGLADIEDLTFYWWRYHKDSGLVCGSIQLFTWLRFCPLESICIDILRLIESLRTKRGTSFRLRMYKSISLLRRFHKLCRHDLWYITGSICFKLWWKSCGWTSHYAVLMIPQSFSFLWRQLFRWPFLWDPLTIAGSIKPVGLITFSLEWILTLLIISSLECNLILSDLATKILSDSNLLLLLDLWTVPLSKWVILWRRWPVNCHILCDISHRTLLFHFLHIS